MFRYASTGVRGGMSFCRVCQKLANFSLPELRNCVFSLPFLFKDFAAAGTLKLVQSREIGVAMGTNMVSQIDVPFAVGADSRPSEGTGIFSGNGRLAFGCQDGSADLLCSGLRIELSEYCDHNRTVGGN